MYVHWQQDRLSKQLQEAFEEGEGTITFNADDWVVPGEEIETFGDDNGYNFDETEDLGETDQSETSLLNQNQK
jgi:hypothetical protein